MPKFQKILHPEKFNLILYYAITSICGISASAYSKGSHVVETLLESYYPLYKMQKNGTKKEQVGVLEIYQDMSALKKQMTKAR